jgi:hypothetical protein
MQDTLDNQRINGFLVPPSHTIRFLKKLIPIAESNYEKSIIEKLINDSQDLNPVTKKVLIGRMRNEDANLNC